MKLWPQQVVVLSYAKQVADVDGKFSLVLIFSICFKFTFHI